MVAVGTPAVGVALGASRPCSHLAPLERLLAATGRPVGPGRPCKHDPDWGTWFAVDAPLDARQIKRQVHLDPCVHDEEYEGVLVPGDVTFYCTCCQQAIVGELPLPPIMYG